MISRQPKRFYVFNQFRIDMSERVLIGERGIVPLTPKAFDTLLVLVENNGHMLTKEELMQRVWPDSFVEDNNLAQNISLLRKVLSRESGGRNFIQTVPKRGYRFLADVRERLEATGGRRKRFADNEMQASCNEKNKSFLMNVVLIGRAIDFK